MFKEIQGLEHFAASTIKVLPGGRQTFPSGMTTLESGDSRAVAFFERLRAISRLKRPGEGERENSPRGLNLDRQSPRHHRRDALFNASFSRTLVPLIVAAVIASLNVAMTVPVALTLMAPLAGSSVVIVGGVTSDEQFQTTSTQ